MKIAVQGLGVPEPVPATGFALTAPGMTGTVESLTTAEATTRAALRSYIEQAASAITDAGAELAVIGQLQLELQLRPDRIATDTRGSTVGSPTLHVDMRDQSTGYAVLYVDEATGASKWVFSHTRDDRAAQKRLVFELPQVVDSSVRKSEPGGTRGIMTGTMRALVKVVAWVSDPLVGAAALAIAKRWETRRRPYGLHQVTDKGDLVDPDWSVFTGEPVLLLVHGTFSTPAAGFFGWLGKPPFVALHAQYAGRCLAFAHPTMHTSPDENVDWLLRALPPDKRWIFDTISHSRGGLVSRALAAQGAAKNACQINRMIMVAPPNFGTPLADAKHWTTFLNAYTNLLITAPDSVSTIVAEGVLCLVKILGSGIANNLPGLAAMNLAGEYLPSLANRTVGNPNGMFVVAADYSPSNLDALKKLMLSTADTAIDQFFNEPNDLVVPTLGCSEGPINSLGFPIEQGRVFKLTGSSNHCNVFEDSTVHRKLSTWLE